MQLYFKAILIFHILLVSATKLQGTKIETAYDNAHVSVPHITCLQVQLRFLWVRS